MVEHDALSATREAYDAAAPAYAELFRDTLRDSPLDRAILGAFAEVVSVLGGVLSRWSVIHTPPQELPVILAQFHRVLAPGGHLLIGFSAAHRPAAVPGGSPARRKAQAGTV